MDYSNEIRDKYAKPSEEVIEVRGEEWARTLQIRCPVCGHGFYGWQAIARPQVPGYSDPEPEVIDGISMGARRTCGSIYCANAEDEHQIKRGSKYSETCRRYYAERANTTPEAKSSTLRRAGS